jgi:endonuclease III
MSDFAYRTDGMFTLILPETPQAVEAWEAIAEQTDGTGKVLTAHLPAVMEQIRRAGYTIRKATAIEETDAELLDSLNA